MEQLIRIKKIVISIILIMLLFSLGGCVGQKELNNLGIINLMGIDLTADGEYKVTVHILKPSTGQGGEPANAPGPGSAIWVGQAEGETIEKAVKEIRAKTSWLLIWSHCDIFVLGNKLCRTGIGNVVDFLARNEEIRLTSNVITATDKAWQILKHSPEEKKEPVADQIDGLIKNIADWSKAYNLNLKEVMARLASGDQEVVLGKLELVRAEPVKEGQESSSSSGGQTKKDELKKVLKMEGAAVFKKDKLVGSLTPEETRGYMRIIDEIKLHSMDLFLSGHNSPVSLNTYDSQIEIKWDSANPKKFLISIKELSRLAEQDLQISQTSLLTTNKIESLKEEAVKREVISTIKKSKQLQSDIFGLKGIIKQKSPSTWEKLRQNWEKKFSNLSFKVEVESILKQVGKIHKPIFE